MVWLPSARDMPDPFHLESMRNTAIKNSKLEFFEGTSKEIYKLTLQSLRSFRDIPDLRAGKHNFNPVAKGCALYAFRMAASEIILETQKYWTTLLSIYFKGNFPCGILPNNKIIVF